MPTSWFKTIINSALFYSVGIFTFILPVNIVHAADITAPTTESQMTPSTPSGNAGWYTNPVSIKLTATDLASGVKSINYKIDNGAWQTVVFNDALNLAANPSFEDLDDTNTSQIQYWTAGTQDALTTYLRDTSQYAPNYATTSAKIISTGTGWHGINNQTNFAVATPLKNMSASAWIKTQDVSDTAFFKIYAVTQDNLGNIAYEYIGQSNTITGTADWSLLSYDFVLSPTNAIGVYMDIGLINSGTIWADTVSISLSNTSTNTTFSVGTDGTHTVQYYSVDAAGNTEGSSCSGSVHNCISFKIDQTPPGNWHDSGAIRGLGGSDHELYVYTTVEDETSGISTFTDSYTYHTELNTGFGSFTSLLKCNTAWQPEHHVILISPPFLPGVKSAYLVTPKTDFCNNNWKVCKVVRFYAEDLAGNTSTKDFCINGPWVQFTGGGIVRSNGGINMISEAPNENTDGLIIIGNEFIGFFTSSKEWYLKSNTISPKDFAYNDWINQVTPSPTTITALNTTTGVYKINGNFDITNAKIPSGYGSSTFTQIIFVNGNLKISNNISIASGSAALYIVSGDVEIAKSVDTLGIAIFADGNIYTAYDIAEGDSTNTLTMTGIYVANQIHFQRTLQGTNNSKNPSEIVNFAPKYAMLLGSYLGINDIKWLSSN